MTTQNVRYLRQHGPVPIRDLPGKIRIGDRQRGVWKFKVRTNAIGGSLSVGGRTVDVCYLKETHSGREVVAAWLQANPRAVEAASPRQLRNLLLGVQSDFDDAVRELVPAAPTNNPSGFSGDATCPLCEAPMTPPSELPIHLATEHGGSDDA